MRPDLERLLDHVIDGGSHAVFVAGSTGEFPGLAASTLDALYHEAARLVDGRVPVLAGVGGAATAGSCELIKAAGASGVDGVVALAPFYFLHSQEELTAHFLRLRDASKVPVILYENSHTTKNAIDIDTVGRLMEEDGIDGLKDSSGDRGRFMELVELVKPRDDFFLLNGDTRMSGETIMAGADGFVPGIGNLVPGLCRMLYDAASSGDEAAMGEIQAECIEVMGLYSGRIGRPVVCLKHAMDIIGICGPTPAAPFLPVTDAESAQVKAVLDRLGIS